MREIADRYNRSVLANMRATARAAVLDPNMPGLHAHNAHLAAYYGRPWRGVDYSLVRRVLWLDRDVQWWAHDVLDRWVERTNPLAVQARRAEMRRD